MIKHQRRNPGDISGLNSSPFLPVTKFYKGGGGIGSIVGSVLGNMIAPGIGGVIGGALGGAGGSALTGGNPLTGALMGGLGGAANAFGGDAIDAISGSTDYAGQSLAGSIFGTGGDNSIFGSTGLGDLFGGGGNDIASGASSSVNWNDPGLTAAAQGAAPSFDGSAINWNNDLTAPGQSTLSKVASALGGGNSSSSSILGKNPLATLGTLIQSVGANNQSQANQDALKAQQVQQAQFNQNAYNSISNFTPLNRQVVSPQTVGNLNNYGQSGYTGWNGQGGSQLFYNNVNPASYQLPAMKSGGKVNYATGGQVQKSSSPGLSLANILNYMAESYPDAVDVKRPVPLTTSLDAQVYKRGGGVKKPHGISISKSTQLSLPMTSRLSQNLTSQPGIMPIQPQGIGGMLQGLAMGGHVLDRQMHPSKMPMQMMPNYMPKTMNNMPARLNPANPHANFSPLRMMAKGGYLDGNTDGQADTIPAKLSDGEYVLPADVVSHLGNGNNNAGAKVADKMVKNIRIHKNVNPPGVKGKKGRLPPKAKPIVEYVKKRKVKNG